MLIFRIICFVLLLLQACTYKPAAGKLASTADVQFSDSLTLERYKNEIAKEYLDEPETLTASEKDSLLWEMRIGIGDGSITYAPDSSFKIFVIEQEGCGAYCNSQWYSWVHFNLKQNERSVRAPFSVIQKIHKLPDGKYLIIDSSGGRPAGVLTVSCQSAWVISFYGDSLNTFPIGEYTSYWSKAEGENGFHFCQENGVELANEAGHYLKYDEVTNTLHYLFGNNYAYNLGVDIDTIRQGSFVYNNGQFVLEKEEVTVKSYGIGER